MLGTLLGVRDISVNKIGGKSLILCNYILVYVFDLQDYSRWNPLMFP